VWHNRLKEGHELLEDALWSGWPAASKKKDISDRYRR
jgi:hypothetical protein